MGLLLMYAPLLSTDGEKQLQESSLGSQEIGGGGLGFWKKGVCLCVCLSVYVCTYCTCVREMGPNDENLGGMSQLSDR